MAFDPWSLGLSALGGIGSAVGSWFGRPGEESRPQQVPYEGLSSMEEIPIIKEAYLPVLREGMERGPEYYRDMYYKDIYQPAAAETRGTWEEQVGQPVKAFAGAGGVAGATPTINRLAQELTKREMGLATMAGELRARGAEQGLQSQRWYTGETGAYGGREADVQQRAAMAKMGARQAYEGQRQAYGQRQEEFMPQMIGGGLTTMGNIYGALEPADIYQSTARRTEAQERSPFQTGYGGMQTRKNYGQRQSLWGY